MLRVLLISPLPPPSGGIASWTKRYCQSEYAKNHDIRIVNTAVRGRELGQKSKQRLQFEFQRTISILKDLKDNLNKEHFDVVHLNCPCGRLGIIRDYLCCRSVKRNGAALVVHFRCDIANMIKDKIGEFFLKKIVSISDDVWILNKSSKNYIQDKCKRGSVLIPNFITKDFLELDCSKKNMNFTAVYVGHVTEQKGFSIIMKLAESFPLVTFQLIGSVAPELIDNNNKSNVNFFGEITPDEVKLYLQQADVFLFPSHTEGFPNAIAEAMAVGLPIVASNVGAIPNMIESSGGFVCEVDHFEQFYDAIESLQFNEKLRQGMSQWNKNKAKMYEIENVMQQIFNRYEKCIHSVEQ